MVRDWLGGQANGQQTVSSKSIPFNWPYMTGQELHNIAMSHALGRLAGDGTFTKYCQGWIERHTGASKALLTHSCTAALEMAALLLDIGFGDEVIMPSYTFVSTANAFVLRGAVPVFIDIRADTLNLDETLIEAAITPRTRAIVVVHYAGVACEMDTILAIAARHGLKVVEDAAQAIMASYKGRALGGIGDLGAFSFHETKNIISGEGGALLVNEESFSTRAEIIREKGTDRSRFFRGEVDKYTWQDVGSSFLPGELTAAFLAAQLDEAETICARRAVSWQLYHELIAPLEAEGYLRRPVIPDECRHNGHLYYLLLAHPEDRQTLLNIFRAQKIDAVFHYVPLHDSPAGQRFGRADSPLPVTLRQAERLVRLPLWCGIEVSEQERVVEVLAMACRSGALRTKDGSL
jgi:dTDP-4-amino-4,6-dideoxygalactose transaminase